MRKRIAAVVVTYNRLESLKKCLNRLLSQTYLLDDIIVVNNGSTDDTKNWLDSQGKFIVINQANLGSGGGQYRGLKYAFEQGYDWVWCMDDDGFPQEDTLEELVKSPNYSKEFVLGSIVLAENDPSKLAFHMPVLEKGFPALHYFPSLTDEANYLTEIHKEGLPWGAFFNSVLIPRSCMHICGFPKAELFIWGDEVEYFFRIKKLYKKIWIVPQSKFYHPKPNQSKIVRWKEMYMHRNKVYIQKNYYHLSFLRFIIRLLSILLRGKWYLLRPIWDGLISNFVNDYHLKVKSV